MSPVMDTENTVEKQLLDHAARQTKALENINWVLMALFVLSLIVGGILAISAIS